MKLGKIHKAYFVGIGGIGMSALARHFHANNVEVSGYDRVETELCKKLVVEGIEVYYEEDVERIPKDVDVIVYTPAIPEDHSELQYYRSHDFPVMKRAEILGSFSKSMTTIAVAGTHGKSTVSSMIAYLLKETEYDCTAFLGAISKNYGTNYLQGFNDLMVVEADEFDRSFLTLETDLAVITSVEADHLDIYINHDEFKKAFIEFSNNIHKEGCLVLKSSIDLKLSDHMEERITYSLKDENADCYLVNHYLENDKQVFSFKLGGELYEDFKLQLGGYHNIENMLAAICTCYNLGLDPEFVRASVETYEGLKRRFEKVYESGKTVYIDDYAHHPTELNVLIESIRETYPGKKLTIVFQPHLYSRTKDFAGEFAKSLDKADEIILLPIYPAREKSIEGVESDLILDKMENSNKRIVSRSALLDEIEWDNLEILVTAGAGNIDQEVEKIHNYLNQRNAEVLE